MKNTLKIILLFVMIGFVFVAAQQVMIGSTLYGNLTFTFLNSNGTLLTNNVVLSVTVTDPTGIYWSTPKTFTINSIGQTLNLLSNINGVPNYYLINIKIISSNPTCSIQTIQFPINNTYETVSNNQQIKLILSPESTYYLNDTFVNIYFNQN